MMWADGLEVYRVIAMTLWRCRVALGEFLGVHPPLERTAAIIVGFGCAVASGEYHDASDGGDPQVAEATTRFLIGGLY